MYVYIVYMYIKYMETRNVEKDLQMLWTKDSGSKGASSKNPCHVLVFVLIYNIF